MKGSSVFCHLIIEKIVEFFIASLYIICCVYARQAGRQLFALLEIERAECLQVTSAKVAVASPLLKLFDFKIISRLNRLLMLL